MAHLNPIQQTLLDLLANTLFDAKRQVRIADPAALWTEANYQAVFLTALRDADAEAFPPALLEEIHYCVNRFLATNIRTAVSHAKLSCLLEDAGIGHVLIKGYASAIWYPQPEMRQLGDIDFYVDPAYVERTEALLLKEGFVPEKMSHSFHHVFRKDGCRFELHYEIPGVPDSALADRCRSYFTDLIGKSAVRHTDFGEMRLPDVFHHGLILLLHTAHHLTHSGIGLRHLCDWAVYIQTLPETQFRALFETPLKQLGLWSFACCLTDICVRYLGVTPVGFAKEADEAVSDALLDDLFAGGNFGQKVVVRSRQAYLITAGKRTDSSMRRMVTVLTDMVYQKWPVSKKIKPLVPVGLAFYTARYAVRVAAGKRPKLYAREALAGAKARTELYEKLRLFDAPKEDIV